MFTDVHVQERIVQSYTSILIVRNQVSSAVTQLMCLRRAHHKHMKSLEAQIAQTVVDA